MSSTHDYPFRLLNFNNIQKYYNNSHIFYALILKISNLFLPIFHIRKKISTYMCVCNKFILKSFLLNLNISVLSSFLSSTDRLREKIHISQYRRLPCLG